MIEADVEDYARKEIAKAGGKIRKVKWIGRRAAPDDFVLLPGVGRGIWVEFKKPGEKPTAAQLEEHRILRKYGERVEVIDSIAAVDSLLAEVRCF